MSSTAFRTRFLALAITTTLASAAAVAAPPARGPGSDARYQNELAVCNTIQQDHAACIREAGAAREEARRNGLTSAAPASYQQNALARCQLQPPAERLACEQRVTGTGVSSIEGSVLGGGVIRETVTPVN
ncbi:hypothetical protein [Variovorax sp. dw_954]|uniref:hypothetical protein n=1 Tax=Variovorax sp. dw_954 TaxID=2720078 RepID=UPI001BD659DB|nr:hypothetical protein [Variovorax sp. dw_954]